MKTTTMKMTNTKVLEPNWQVPHNIKSFITSRAGGVSLKPFDSLNLGLHVNDNSTLVNQNRQIVSEIIDIKSPPLWLNQTHSTDAITSSKHYDGINADAIITTNIKQPLVIMTADCLPILLTNTAGTEVAAIHAGWLGLSQGIIKNTVNKMLSKEQDLIVWLGPCISQKYFEVGLKVKTAFQKIDTKANNGFTFNKQTKKYHACLHTLAINQLERLNIKNYYQTKLCTYANDDLFFSYRRQKITGRMGTFIWLEN